MPSPHAWVRRALGSVAADSQRDQQARERIWTRLLAFLEENGR
jgi:hypothetical protein